MSDETGDIAPIDRERGEFQRAAILDIGTNDTDPTLARVPAREPAGRVTQDPDLIGDSVAHDGDITPPIPFQQAAAAGRDDAGAFRLIETDIARGFGLIDVARKNPPEHGTRAMG